MAMRRLALLGLASTRAMASTSVGSELASYGYEYTYYEDLYENWTQTGCRYAMWEDLDFDFYERFYYKPEDLWALIGNNTFLSTHELEAWVFGDEGNARGDRTPYYDSGVSPTAWLVDDLEAPPIYLYPEFQLTDFDVDEHKGSFKVSGFFKLGWTDFRLAYAYTPACFAQFGTKYRWLLNEKYHSKLWQRDWYLVNAVGPSALSARTTSIWIYPSGWLVEKQQIMQELKCDLDLRELPFDRQKCKMRIGISGLTSEKAGFEVPVASFQDPDGDKVENAQWKILEVKVYTELQEYFTQGKATPADEVDLYSEAYIEFTLQRKPLFYFVEVVLPAILFLFVAYIGFYINANVAPARVGVTVIPVLIMRTLLNQTYGRMQIIAYFTRLTNFLVMSQALSVFCVAEFGIVSYFLAVEKDAELARKALVRCHKLLVANITAPPPPPPAPEREDDEAIDVLEVPLRDDRAEPSAPKSFSSPAGCWGGGTIDDDDVDPVVALRQPEEFAPRPPPAPPPPPPKPATSRHRLMSICEKVDHPNPIVRQHIKKLKALFDAYDADRNGTVDAPELSKALETYNFYLTSEQTYYTSAPPAPPRPARAPRRPRPPRAQCSTTSTSTART